MQTKSALIAGAGLGLLLFFPIPSLAQENTIRANIRGGGGDGKCTFEVEVDKMAEVEIRGDQGYLRTISGREARWRRLDCNQPLPSSPNDFRFKGIDGRGRQDLVRDPNSNRGVAVIRIEDPKGGREGYTGDIMWRGGSDRSDFRRDRADRSDESNARTVSCSSDDGRRRYCDAETRAGVTGAAARQRSMREGLLLGIRRSRYLGRSGLPRGFRSRSGPGTEWRPVCRFGGKRGSEQIGRPVPAGVSGDSAGV
jgi:hypothetical protein